MQFHLTSSPCTSAFYYFILFYCCFISFGNHRFDNWVIVWSIVTQLKTIRLGFGEILLLVYFIINYILILSSIIFRLIIKCNYWYIQGGRLLPKAIILKCDIYLLTTTTTLTLWMNYFLFFLWRNWVGSISYLSKKIKSPTAKSLKIRW